MDLLELIRGKKVMVGAIDVATHAIETPEQVANPAQGTAIRRCRQALPLHQLRHGACLAR
jgi:5-methyltetrahydropteroyltriglutamate--homocysteine methyltransferase